MKIINRPTDHWEERRDGAKPSFLILHYTETIGPQKAEDYFLGRIKHPGGGRVSVHYMLDEQGEIIHYVDEDKRAWHAGLSWWGGVEDINSHSIGIELVNPGHKKGYRAFPPAQMAALIKLSKEIIKRHDIIPLRVLGHSDIAPVRKIDPGELFDWKMLAAAGVGAWPQPDEVDYQQGELFLTDQSILKRAFIEAGYDPKADMKSLITAFQRHFYQEAFQHAGGGTAVEGEMDQEAAARLNWLLRQKPAP